MSPPIARIPVRRAPFGPGASAGPGWSVPGRPALGWRVLGWLVLAAATAFLIVIARTGVTVIEVQRWVDLDIYLASARTFERTGELYCLQDCRALGFTYPPLAVLPFQALAHLPIGVARGLWTALTIAVLLYTLHHVLDRAGVRRHHLPWLMAPVVVSEPVRMTIGQGQVSVLIACLALLGMTVASPRGGVLVALGAAVKLTPALSMLPLLASGDPLQRKRFGYFAGVGVLLLAGSLAVGVQHNLDYLRIVLPDTDRVGSPASISNNSILGLFAHWRLSGPVASIGNVLLGVALFVVLIRCARGLRLHDARARAAYAIACGLLTCLVTPISWTHHCLFAALAAALLLASGHPRTGVLALAVWIAPLMFIAVEQTRWPATALIQSIRPLSLLLLFVLLVRPLLREPGPTGPGATGPGATGTVETGTAASGPGAGGPEATG